MVDIEIALSCFVMCIKDRYKKTGGGIISYIKNVIHIYYIYNIHTIPSKCARDRRTWVSTQRSSLPLTVSM